MYSAKELQEMTGWYDFGNRMQDPIVGRFWVPDRFAEKYYHLSPYQYAGNNPINIIDINGDSLQIVFTEDTYTSFTNMVNTGLEGQFRVFYKNGEGGKYLAFLTATDGGGDISKLSKEGKAFFDAMVEITTGNGIANVTLVKNDPKVNIGNFDNGFIDMGDISQFNSWDTQSPRGATQQGKLIHEIGEQYYKARLGYTHDGNRDGYGFSHNQGIKYENAVNGNNRTSERYRPGLLTVDYVERNGTITTTSYNTGTRLMKVTQTIK